ncbi:MAG: DUF5829 family protein [Actinomycetota bacterium]|nr:DUF5829 family protein [Actinomycetota bacterium]
MAFLDHVFTVVGAETADAIAECEFLRSFGRFSVHTTVADGETWTGRYLSGRGTYVELFGPDDVDGPDGAEGSTGIGLSPHERGGLGIVSDRLKGADLGLQTGQRTRQEGDEQVPWFDHVSAPGDPETLRVWVMEYHDDPTDRQRRESAWVEWTKQCGDAHPPTPGPFVVDISGVELGTSIGDIARVGPIFEAAGFAVSRSGGLSVAQDVETTIRLDSSAVAGLGLRRVEFVLVAPSGTVHVEVIGHSTLTVGPGNHAVWDFTNP